MNTPLWLIVHHTAVSQKDTERQFASVNTYHKQKFNFISSLGYYVGYQWFIEKDGTVIQARSDDEEGAHTIGLNNKSIGICLAGDFDVEFPTSNQITSLHTILAEKTNLFNISLDKIVPHRKFANKSCYGSKLSDSWAADLLREEKVTLLKSLLELYQKLLLAIKGR